MSAQSNLDAAICAREYFRMEVAKRFSELTKTLCECGVLEADIDAGSFYDAMLDGLADSIGRPVARLAEIAEAEERAEGAAEAAADRADYHRRVA